MVSETDLAYAAGVIGRYGYKRGVHHWRLNGQKAADFCRMIRPYLRLKQRQAELLIQYREDLQLDHTRRGGQGQRLSAEEIARRRDYAAVLRSLNQREKEISA